MDDKVRIKLGSFEFVMDEMLFFLLAGAIIVMGSIVIIKVFG